MHDDALNLRICKFLSPPGLRACPRGTRHLRSVLPSACDYERFAAMLATGKQKNGFVTKSHFYGISETRGRVYPMTMSLKLNSVIRVTRVITGSGRPGGAGLFPLAVALGRESR